MAARRHMHEYGTTLEQLAEVAVQARANAARTRRRCSATRSPSTTCSSGPMIADPFTKLHCCIRSDGGAAVLLSAEDLLPDCAHAPVWVLGSGEHVSHTTMSEWDDFTVSPAAVSGRLAFERAGVTPDEIDLAEIYDAFTYMTLVTLEDLGFCAKGEGGPFVEKGRLLRDGGAARRTRTAAACRPNTRGCGACSCWWRRYGSCAGEAGERQVRKAGGRPAAARGGVRHGRMVLLVGNGGAGARVEARGPRPRRDRPARSDCGRFGYTRQARAFPRASPIPLRCG